MTRTTQKHIELPACGRRGGLLDRIPVRKRQAELCASQWFARVNRELLTVRLERQFGGSPEERRVVVRQAGDLHDSGRYVETHGEELTVGTVIDNLAEAPDDNGLVDRWNWWIGALDLAHTSYDRFRVRRWTTE